MHTTRQSTTRSCSPTPGRCSRAGPAGSIQYIDGDLRDGAAIMEVAARTLDFGRPVGLMLLGILHLVQDDEDPYRRPTAASPASPDRRPHHTPPARDPG
jgi:hypothetical protein